MQVQRLAMGQYLVTLDGLGAAGESGGNVMVTAYGRAPSVCQPSRWITSTGNLQAYVNCFSTRGGPIDSQFTMTAHYPERAGLGYAYTWANNPTMSTYTPVAGYTYNPAGGSTSIQRTGVGAYQVTFAGVGTSMAASGGQVQVSAYGPTFAQCNVGSWSKNAGALRVNVRCYDDVRAPKDNLFVAYVTWAGEHYPLTQSYAWSDSAVPPAAYAPSAPYSLGTGNAVNRLGTGSYRVTLGPSDAYQLLPSRRRYT